MDTIRWNFIVLKKKIKNKKKEAKILLLYTLVIGSNCIHFIYTLDTTTIYTHIERVGGRHPQTSPLSGRFKIWYWNHLLGKYYFWRSIWMANGNRDSSERDIGWKKIKMKWELHKIWEISSKPKHLRGSISHKFVDLLSQGML